MEFHISRASRDRYQFDQSLFSYHGNVIFANFHAARAFAQKINQRRDLVTFPEKAVRAGDINAMGLIDEILHHVVNLYQRQRNPGVMAEALQYLEEALGREEVDQVLIAFTRLFPPISVYQNQQSLEDYLQGVNEVVPNRQAVLEEMLMLWVTNKNPAMEPFAELFADDELRVGNGYLVFIDELYAFFETQPRFGPDQQNLVDMLRAPAVAIPYSLSGQLEYIRERWSELLGRYLYRLLTSLDLIREEEKISFFGMGPGPVPIPVYDAAWAAEHEMERFSMDREWMPRLVLIAKNTYVWLSQLSKHFDRPITRLDQIPDEELDRLAAWGFSGLWLIGLWERSQASAEIKRMMGNSDAIASAYSLYSYDIAGDLGGEEAYRNLRDRAWLRGIRLASDMVPNHMGLDSWWVTQHPDRFVSLDYSPYPSYSFNGPNLSRDPAVGLYIEDHYYDKTDAAVVFKRVDHNTGRQQFIYHGNDGTSMPWNDTAQLNYLNPDVREAVIQTIIAVARRFPIIRFDAAMTLAKKHYQRLWFPEPGSGGDIPSRSEFGMTREQFDALMPIEFWREVVDRMAVEAPDTLLLAEAFWLMEGYFVRTLGMHRVYNSAFMNLLRNEENAKYRLVMKNTLEFDPEILKRYVNFMNNPDERTAVDQFGKGDKYFGICILMATMPGLPMFGHGQIEGFAEKYGMEFKRPMWEETPDPYLVQRHEREVFPLLHRRAMFSGVENFLLYDFFSNEGFVNEDVFAYSNGSGNERNLVVFHNKFASTSGWIRTSVGFLQRQPDGERRMVQRSLAEGLNLNPSDGHFVIFRDSISHVEYIRSTSEIEAQGLFLDLHAYKYYVFVDFHQVQDDMYQSYRHLCTYLNGRGVPSIEEALRELVLQPVQNPFQQIANPGYFKYLISSVVNDEEQALDPHVVDEAINKQSALLHGAAYLTGQGHNMDAVLLELRARMETLLSLPMLTNRFKAPGSRTFPAAAEYLTGNLDEQPEHWMALFSWVFLHNLGRLSGLGDVQQTLSWMDEWQLGRSLSNLYQDMGLSEALAWRTVNLVRILVEQQHWYDTLGSKALRQILETWLSDDRIQTYLGINRFKDVLWFNQEALEEFAWWMSLVAALDIAGQPRMTNTQMIERILGAYEISQELLAAEEGSGYQVQKLLDAAGPAPKALQPDMLEADQVEPEEE